MKKALKWDFSKKEYEEIEISIYCSAFEADMQKIIECCQCGDSIAYGASYTSRQIHTVGGFGYAVCEECYEKEWEQERWSEVN